MLLALPENWTCNVGMAQKYKIAYQYMHVCVPKVSLIALIKLSDAAIPTPAVSSSADETVS